MKKGFMNKKATEMTGWEVLKFTGIMTAALTAVVYIPMWIWIYWKQIFEAFSDLKDCIRHVFHRKEQFVDNDFEEEDEEL